MDVARNSTNHILTVGLRDDGLVAITGVVFNDPDLTLEVRRYTDANFVPVTLVDGTLGAFLADSWKEIGNGDYQWCPNDDMVINERPTAIRLTYGTNRPLRDTLNAIGSPGAITVTPVQGVMVPTLSGTGVRLFQNETKIVALSVTDANGDAVDITGMTLEVVIENRSGTDRAVVADGDITKVSNTLSFAAPSASTAVVGDSTYAVRNTGDDSVLLHGSWSVLYAALNDV